MNSLHKKPSLMCSAFLFLSLFLTTSLKAQVDCVAQSFNYIVTRSEVTGTGSANNDDLQQTVNLGTKTGTLVNQQVDLNIQLDVNAVASGVITVTSSSYIWRVLAANKDKVRGFIVADYQFQGLMPNDDKICSSPTSCIDIVSVTPVNQFVDRQGGNDSNTNKSIIEASESLQLTLDLSGITDAGNYTAMLTVSLLHDANADGVGEQTLACDNTP